MVFKYDHGWSLSWHAQMERYLMTFGDCVASVVAQLQEQAEVPDREELLTGRFVKQHRLVGGVTPSTTKRSSIPCVGSNRTCVNTFVRMSRMTVDAGVGVPAARSHVVPVSCCRAYKDDLQRAPVHPLSMSLASATWPKRNVYVQEYSIQSCVGTCCS